MDPPRLSRVLANSDAVARVTLGRGPRSVAARTSRLTADPTVLYQAATEQPHESQKEATRGASGAPGRHEGRDVSPLRSGSGSRDRGHRARATDDPVRPR